MSAGGCSGGRRRRQREQSGHGQDGCGRENSLAIGTPTSTPIS
jgi:hypothetical protein